MGEDGIIDLSEIAVKQRGCSDLANPRRQGNNAPVPLRSPSEIHAAGPAAYVDLPDGGFSVASRHPHAHPRQGELLSLKAVLEGAEEYRLDDRRYEIGAGRVLLIPEGLPYASRVLSPSVAMCPVFFSRAAAREVLAVTRGAPEEDLLEESLPSCVQEEALLPRGHALQASMRRIWALTRRAAQETSPDDARHALREETLLALSRALDSRERLTRRLQRLKGLRPATRLEFHRRLARAEDRMHADPGGKLDLEALARTACMSPFHFLRRFSAFYGETPTRPPEEDTAGKGPDPLRSRPGGQGDRPRLRLPQRPHLHPDLPELLGCHAEAAPLGFQATISSRAQERRWETPPEPWRAWYWRMRRPRSSRNWWAWPGVRFRVRTSAPASSGTSRAPGSAP